MFIVNVFLRLFLVVVRLLVVPVLLLQLFIMILVLVIGNMIIVLWFLSFRSHVKSLFYLLLLRHSCLC